jgi:uncharacterized protein with ATP-grasp and redox domains
MRHPKTNLFKLFALDFDYIILHIIPFDASLPMRTYLDCIPCFFEQALRAARLATSDESEIRTILDRIGRMLPGFSLEKSPPELASNIYELIEEITGNRDVYRVLKKESTAKALTLYPGLKEIVHGSDDRLSTALKIAVAGNIIDFGINSTFDVETVLNEVLHKDFAVFDQESFAQDLAAADNVLYIGDNAGETVFDRVLIEEMRKPAYYAVRSRPIINDAVYQDAVDAGLDEVSTIIASGSAVPGTIIGECSPQFIDLFENSGLVISKGQGNYETLSDLSDKSDVGRPVYFLLMVKCPVLTDHLGVNQGDIILKRLRAGD